jgi:hypothetical protein
MPGLTSKPNTGGVTPSPRVKADDNALGSPCSLFRAPADHWAGCARGRCAVTHASVMSPFAPRKSAIHSATRGDSESLKWFVQHGRGYLNLIREHIRKEDTCLFPAANHHLAETEQERLLSEFDKVEADEIGKGVHDHFLRLANELVHGLHVPVHVISAEPAASPAGSLP